MPRKTKIGRPEKKKSDIRNELFVKYYFAEKFNATAAAKKAGFSEKTAYSQGQRLLKNVEVQKLLNLHYEKLNEKVNLSGEEILRELKFMGFSSVSDIIETMDAAGVKYKDWNAIPEGVKKSIESVRVGKDGISFKMHSKTKALELLGKNRGIFADKVVEMSFEEWLKMQEENGN